MTEEELKGNEVIAGETLGRDARSMRQSNRTPKADVETSWRTSDKVEPIVSHQLELNANPLLPAFAADFPEAIDLASLDGSNGFRIDGIDAGDLSGRSVSSAGDVNGDGIDDILIGAYGANPGGESYVVFGGDAGTAATLDLASLDGTNGFRLYGTDAGNYVGISVSSGGDVNGDGFDDIIIGASRANRGAGASYVVLGTGAGFVAGLDLTTLDGTNGFRLDGTDRYDLSGFSVSSAGDVNGDSFDDIIIGAHQVGELDAGASYVVFGRAEGFSASFDLANLDGSNGFRLDGISEGDRSGRSVSSAGDVNGDGFDDVIIGAGAADPVGAYQAGESYIVFGKSAGFAASLHLATLDGSNGFRLIGIDAFDESGFSVSSAGDVNGDDFDDVIIGAGAADPGGDSAAGETYVVFGSGDGFAASFDFATLDGSNGFRLDGIGAGDISGFPVSSAGDVNGDGFDDVIIAARYADPGGDSAAGESYVVFGKASGFMSSFDLASLNGTNGFRLDGVSADDNSGRSVSGAGDVNDDGFDDIIIGAHLADPGGDSGAGESYVIFGPAPSEAVNRIGSAADQTIRGGDFGDILQGKGGSDTLGGGAGADSLYGGGGCDWADYSTANKVRADLKVPGTNTREATGVSYVSIENLRGSNASDHLLGDDLANWIEGLGGRDVVIGRDGDDTLAGGAAKDTLKGGDGADDFELASLLADDADRILDFASGEDRIALDGDVFGLNRVKPGAFVVGTAAGDANDRLIYNDATGKLFFDADGTGAQAKVLIAAFTGAPTLGAADFVVI